MIMRKSFVIMPFSENFDSVYKDAITPSLQKNNCQVIRADTQTEPIITEGIINGIKQANICIADLTGFNKNVLYEVGICHSSKIPSILITQDKPEDLPFDLKQYRIISYKNTKLNDLEIRLDENIKDILKLKELPVTLLQEMLIPSNLENNNDLNPFYIASCPLTWRSALQIGGGFKYLRKTGGDHSGIRGIIQAFGLIKELNILPELVNTGDYIEEVALQKANIYCIASPKANHWTKVLLQKFCENKIPSFSFKPDINSENLRNVHVDIFTRNGIFLPQDFTESEHRYSRDFGLVIRGPHPVYPNCMIMILAGRGAIGTEAACRAVTEPNYIKDIKDRLLFENINLNNYQQSFYAVISLNVKDRDNRVIDINSLKVLDAKPFSYL